MHVRLILGTAIAASSACSQPNPLYYAGDSTSASETDTFGPSTTDEPQTGATDTGTTSASTLSGTSLSETSAASSSSAEATGGADETSGEDTGTTGPATPTCNGSGASMCHQAITYVVGGDPSAVDIADQDADGDADIVVAFESGDAVVLLRNQGAGLFSDDAPVATPGARPTGVCFANLDGRASLDVLTADRDGESVSVFDSADGPPLSLVDTLELGNKNHDCAVGDVDADGDQDVFAALRETDQVALLLNDGLGGLAAPIVVDVLDKPETLSAADIDDDGLVDVAVASQNGGVSFFLSDGEAGLLPTFFTLDAEHFGVRLADMDGDGMMDLVSSRPQTGEVVVYWDILGGDAPRAQTVEVVGVGPGHLTTGDFNADGSLDIAAVLEQADALVLLSGLGGRAFAVTSFPLEGKPEDIASGDLNGDDIDDIVVTLPEAGEVLALLSEASR